MTKVREDYLHIMASPPLTLTAELFQSRGDETIAVGQGLSIAKDYLNSAYRLNVTDHFEIISA